MSAGATFNTLFESNLNLQTWRASSSDRLLLQRGERVTIGASY